MTEIIEFKGFIPDLALSKIRIAKENVRHTEVKVDLEGLKRSIDDFGSIIHPVIVFPESKEMYSLIVGQRRYLAYKELNRTEIPALVIAPPVDVESRKLISFAENVYRRDLPYDDTVELCNYLFDKYRGDKVSKVGKIALELNITPGTVLKYLSYLLIPRPVRDLVEDGSLTRSEAYKIASAWWPNEGAIVRMAREATHLTKNQRKQAIKIGSRSPGTPLEQVIEAAKRAPALVSLPLYIEPETHSMLERAARRRSTDVKSLVLEIIDEWATKEGEH